MDKRVAATLPGAPRRARLPDETGIALVLLAVVVTLSLISPAFRTVGNGFTLLLNGTVIALLAIGQCFVLLTAGIDLSTGANVAMTGVIAALLIKLGLYWPLASLLALSAGTLLGVLNGALIVYLRIPAFIATFSTQGVALALPLILTGAQSVSVHARGFRAIGHGYVAAIPMPVVIVSLLAILAALFLKMTRLGVHIYALGGNQAAARLAGVNVGRTTMFVYGVSGFCAGMGGLVDTSRLMVGFPATGTGNELFYSIAAAVVGGVSLFGGAGTVLGTMIGAVLIAVVSNGMNVINVQSYWQSLVIGIIILLGVSFDTLRRTRSGRPPLRRMPARPPAGEAPPATATPSPTSLE